MSYRYSVEMVYNTFPWPEPGVKGRARIEGAAQGILDARAESEGCSFAAMYDDTVMPVELRRAHERNDEAVCRAYGWPGDIGEEEIVRGLFGMYHEITGT